ILIIKVVQPEMDTLQKPQFVDKFARQAIFILFRSIFFTAVETTQQLAKLSGLRYRDEFARPNPRTPRLNYHRLGRSEACCCYSEPHNCRYPKIGIAERRQHTRLRCRSYHG